MLGWLVPERLVPAGGVGAGVEVEVSEEAEGRPLVDAAPETEARFPNVLPPPTILGVPDAAEAAGESGTYSTVGDRAPPPPNSPLKISCRATSGRRGHRTSLIRSAIKANHKRMFARCVIGR